MDGIHEYKMTCKRVLADGTVKNYSYIVQKNRPISDKRKLFNELTENNEFRKIAYNINLGNNQKINLIYEMTSKHERFKSLTKKQISNLIYRL